MSNSPDKPRHGAEPEQSVNSAPRLERSRAMTETEILECMHKWGIKRLDAKKFRPGEPLLSVLPEQVRHDSGPYRHIKESYKRPCVARIDNPAAIGNDQTGDFIENAGKVHYYYIDGAGIPQHLRTTQLRRSYPAVLEFLFETDDTLFPPK